MPIRPLRAAAVNAAPVFGDVAANVGSAVDWCEQAAEAGVELLVFPEAWNTGYDTRLFALDLPSVEDLSWLASLQDAVDRTSTVVLFNAALSTPDGRKTLTTIVLEPNASPRPVYDKQHLFPLEVGTFTPGDHGATVALRGHEVALSVCYDVDFPEHAAAAAADGATVYVNSGLYFLGSEHRRDLRNAARALDNGMYVVFSGVAGEFAGGSGIYDPLGQPLARLGREPGLAIADLDLETVRRARDSQRAWADHRSSLGSRRHTDLALPAVPLMDAPGPPQTRDRG